jgi:hypothetical protein
MYKDYQGQQQRLFHFVLWMYLTGITTWQLQVSIVATTKTIPFYVLDVSN